MITAETALHFANEANSLNGILEQINFMIIEAAKGGNKSLYYDGKNSLLDPKLKKNVVAQLKGLGYNVTTEVGSVMLYVYW